MTVSPDFKDGPRIRDPQAMRRKLLVDRECQVCGGPAATAHHIIGRDLGGDDMQENLASLCGSGTTDCHGAVEEFDFEARAKLRANMTPEQVAYAVRRKSLAWLDRNYPEEA